MTIRIRLFRKIEVLIFWRPTVCQTPYLHFLIYSSQQTSKVAVILHLSDKVVETSSCEGAQGHADNMMKSRFKAWFPGPKVYIFQPHQWFPKADGGEVPSGAACIRIFEELKYKLYNYKIQIFRHHRLWPCSLCQPGKGPRNMFFLKVFGRFQHTVRSGGHCPLLHWRNDRRGILGGREGKKNCILAVCKGDPESTS